MLWIKIGHSSHKEGDNVGIAEVNYKNLNEFPILFVIDISDEVHFYFFNFVQALGQFEDNKHSKDSHKVLLGSDVHQQDSHTHEVDPEVLRNVKLYDVLNHFYLSTCWELDRNKIKHNLGEIEGQTTWLNNVDKTVLATQQVLKDERHRVNDQQGENLKYT